MADARRQTPYEVFRYLVRRDRGADDAEAVENRYSLATLASRPVVQDEGRGHRYLVFRDRAALWAYIESLPTNERSLHEVVFGGSPQRLKLDIDVPAHKLDAISQETLRACLGSDRACAATAGTEPEPDPAAEGFLAELLDEMSPEPEPKVAAPPESAADALRRERDTKMAAILEFILDRFADELFMAYYALEDVTTTRQDLIVAESSGRTAEGWKYSYHVIVAPYAVPDNEEARELTRHFLDGLPEPLRRLVDGGVNKKLQNFRLALNSKPGAERFKVVTAATAAALGTLMVDPAETMISAPSGMRVLPRVFTGEPGAVQAPTKALELTDADVALVVDCAAQRTTGHELRVALGALLVFTRLTPTFCRICGEVHHKDNTLMLSVEPVEAGRPGPWPGREPVPHRVIEHCRHSPGKGEVAGDVELVLGALRVSQRGGRPRAGGGGQQPSVSRVAARVDAIAGGRVNPHDAAATLFESVPESQKTLYDAPEMQAYELAPTLAVKAQMKLGKTRALRAYLNTNFPQAGLREPVIRFITFRQTFSNSLKEQFPDFALYSDVKGDLDHVRFPRLIVQVESLHRVPMPAPVEPTDLLILDEVESILAQFNSGLHKHFNAAFAMFRWLLKTARHVVCMDANLGDRTFRTLQRMRPDYPIHFHWNRHARAAGDEYFFADDQTAWLDRLHASVSGGKAVVLASNSLDEAKALYEGLKRAYPLKKVGLYSSETSQSEKTRHFANVHEFWGQLDVLIYTPTVSAGVSFELEHFDVLFGYFSDMSCDVETCRQMLGRVRNIRDREHFIFLRGVPNNLPTTVDAIRCLVHDKRAGLYRSLDDDALQFEYTADGSVLYYESDYFHLWTETVRVENLSKNRFIERFIDQVADTGARVTRLAKAAPSAATLLADHRGMKQEIQQARCDAVAGAEDITAQEAAEIREDLDRARASSGAAVVDVPDARKFAYEKWQLRDVYAWHDRPVNAAFVENYSDDAPRRVYRNLTRITAKATVFESLRAISERESVHYRYLMAGRVGGKEYMHEGRDLLRDKRTYVFQAHFLAIWLLRLCGFACLTDRAFIHEALLEGRLRSAMPAIEKAAPSISFEFEVRRPSLSRLSNEADPRRFLTGVLSFVNAVLRYMYGIEVKRVTVRNGGKSFYINQADVARLFVFSAEPEPVDMPDAKPHIASELLPVGGGRATVALVRFLEDEYVFWAAVWAADEDSFVADDHDLRFEPDGDLTRVTAVVRPAKRPLAEAEQMANFLEMVYQAI